MSNIISSTIIDIINNKIVPNLQGETITNVTIDNIADFGEHMSSLPANALKDYTNTFVTAIIESEWNLAETELLKLPIYKNALKYGAILQSIYRKGVTNAEESKAFTLQNGATYDLETYHGFDFDVKLYDIDDSFRLVYSIPNSLYESAFTNIAPLVAYIHECVDNDMTEKVNGLILTCYQGLIAKHSAKRVKLVTEYNTFKGLTGSAQLTWAKIKADSDKLRDFLAFANETICNGRRGMISRSKKYNDGTVISSTPIKMNKLTVIAQFDKMLDTHAYSNIHHPDYIELPERSLIDFWQGSGAGTIPAFDDVTKVDVTITEDVEGTPTPTTYTINNVVAVAHDDRACALMVAPNKTTSSYNGNGDFVTYYDYYTARHKIETRANAIVFTLE